MSGRRPDLPFLFDTARRLNRALDLSKLLEEVRDVVNAAVGSEACSLLLFSEDHRRLEFYLAYNEVQENPRLVYLEPGQGLAGAIAAGGQTVVSNDVLNDPRFRREIDRALGFQTVSFLGLPLRRGAAVLGVLAAVNKREGLFDDADVALLASLTELLAPALDNALLFRQLQRERAENEALYRIGLTLNRKVDLDEILEVLLDEAARLVPYQAGAVYLIHWDTRELEWFAVRGYDAGTDERVRLKLGQGACGWVAREGQPLVIPDVSVETRYVNAHASTRSEVVVPIISEERVIGVFNLESDQLDAFHEADVQLLTAFASQAGISIQRAHLVRELRGKERLENELSIAREIQRSFLPAVEPALPGFEIAGVNVPSREVSGDSFDYLSITRDQLGIMIADVSGKGVPAALILATFRASLRSEIRNEYSIAEIMGKVNRLLSESIEAGKFVTAVYGVLDVTARVFTYANAGHNPPLWLRARTKPRELTDGGLILGSFADAGYAEGRADLRPGDLLVFYTDGVTEAGEPKQDPFGVARLAHVVVANRARASREICQAVMEAVEAHAGEEAWADDRTLVVLKALDSASG